MIEYESPCIQLNLVGVGFCFIKVKNDCTSVVDASKVQCDPRYQFYVRFMRHVF